jgi:hypothetical protein
MNCGILNFASRGNSISDNSYQWIIEKIPVYLNTGTKEHNFLYSTRFLPETLNQLGIANLFYLFPEDDSLSRANVGCNYFYKHL